MRLLLLTSFILSFSLTHPARAEEFEIDCMGPAVGEAKSFYVYLHGLEQRDDDLKRFRPLKDISDKKKVRFAIPKAHYECGAKEFKDKKCWVTGPPNENSYQKSMEIIKAAAEKCFSGKEYGLFGFSAGALYGTTLRQHCVRNDFTKIVAIGFAVPVNDRYNANLRNCKPTLHMMVGDKDPYHDLVKNAYEDFRKREGDVTYEEYEGGHTLQAAPALKFFE